jgi:hypothetical protein
MNSYLVFLGFLPPPKLEALWVHIANLSFFFVCVVVQNCCQPRILGYMRDRVRNPDAYKNREVASKKREAEYRHDRYSISYVPAMLPVQVHLVPQLMKENAVVDSECVGMVQSRD